MKQLRPLRVIQLTDTHLGTGEGFELAGLNTRESLGAVLAEIEQTATSADLLAVTGDIAADAEAGAYKLLNRIMSGIDVSYAWLPGNHDDFSLMREVIDQPFKPVVETDHWELLFLNTSVPNQVGGALAASELQFLQSRLAEGSKHVAIFLHHPPLDVGCKWLDVQQVENSEALAGLVKASNRVKGIFTGHVHQQGEHQWQGCKVYTTPSTCVQFSRNCDEFTLSAKPPGYRIIQFHGDGRIETRVHYLKNSDMKPDRNCIGY